MIKNNKAFTLIEMLVVISLIGILAALALVSFSSAQKQARDSARKSDLKQYQTSLESYGNVTSGLYPSFTTVKDINNSLCDVLKINLPTISCAEDPKYASDNTTYKYKYISNGTNNGANTATTYVVWGKIENKANTYWVVCSNGKTGESAVLPSAPATCPI